MERKQDCEVQKPCVVVVCTYNLELGKQKQDQEFKAILGFKVYLNLTQAT